MRARPIWAVISVAASILLVVTVAVGVVAAVVRTVEGDLAGVAGVAAGTVVSFMFWRWIQVGARHRLRAIDDPASHGPASSVGPWGVVGGVLTVLVLGGLVALAIWSSTSLRADQDRAERLRDEAVAAAKRGELDVDTLRSVHARWLAAAWSGDPDEVLAELFPLEHGRIADLSVDGDTASLLVRPTDGGGPPCAVVDVIHGDVIRGRITNDC